MNGMDLLEAAATRTEDLRSAMSAGARDHVTMAVGMGVDAEGGLRTVIGTSEENGYLRPGVLLNSGEELASGFGHAETNIISYMESNNIDPWTIGATRPICPLCAEAIQGAGAEPATPLQGEP